MPFDIQTLDAKILRLQKIRELMDDPESRAELEQLVTPNGDHAKSSVAEKHVEKPITTALPQNGGPTRKYGEMKKYALEVLSSTPQTVDQILERMITRGFKPLAKAPKPAVTEVLKKLEKLGQAKKAGKARYGTFMWTK